MEVSRVDYLIVWQERLALIGALAMEYPQTFERRELDLRLLMVPEKAKQQLVAPKRRLVAPSGLQRLFAKLQAKPDWEGIEAWDALEAWRLECWPPKTALPLKWRAWMYPLLAEYGLNPLSYLIEPWLTAYFLPAPRWMDWLFLSSEKGIANPPSPILVPFLGESKRSFLKRAEAAYELWQTRTEEDVGNDDAEASQSSKEELFSEGKNFWFPKLHLRWPTRQRDLLFLVWREVEGLSNTAIIERAVKRLREQQDADTETSGFQSSLEEPPRSEETFWNIEAILDRVAKEMDLEKKKQEETRRKAMEEAVSRYYRMDDSSISKAISKARKRLWLY